MEMQKELHEFVQRSMKNKEINLINESTVADFDQRLDTVVEQREQLQRNYYEFKKYKEMQWREHENNQLKMRYEFGQIDRKHKELMK